KIKKDTNNISFEELGIDALFVDEAHKYKNLMFNTKMQVSGLGSKEGNDKTFDLLMKVRHLQKLNGGKGIVFATATPILNSISESYNWFQYLHPKLLEARGIRSFDQFISVFGKVEDVAEITPDGTGYRIKKGISKITNVGQLATLFRSFVDFKTQEMLKLPRPDVKGGDYQVIEVEATEWQKKYIKTLAKRAEALKNGGIDPKVDNMLMVTSDGRKAALHPGLIDPNFELLPGETTKIETAINHLFEHWKKTTKEKLTHLVFIEMSTPKAKKESKKAEEDDETDNFDEVDKKTESVYRQVKDGLIKKGIPKNEIAFIHDAKNPAQKIALKNKFNSGEVRILIGNNEKMGVGIDLQTRTKTITHIDYPWRPKDLQQEDGRALRQGNINKEIETFVIITKRSFDARIWDNLQRKSNVIDGFLNADINDVEIEDPSATTLTAQEISAIASDNPLMKEQVIVTKQLQKLNFEKRGFADARAKLIEKIPYLKSQIEYYTRKLNEYKNLEGKVENITGDNFKAVIDGKTFDKFGEAETYFNELVSKKGENLKYAEADTFEFKLANVIDKVILVQTSQDKNVSRIGLTWKSGDVSITETDTFRGITTTVGNIRRSIERFTQTNNEYQNELDAIYKQLEKKFTKDQEIKELTSRANEIMSILNPEQVIGDGEGEDEYIEEGEVTTATARPMDADQIRTELTSNFPEHTSSEEGVKDLDTAAEALRDLQEVEGSEIPGDRGTLGRNKYEVKVIGNAITTEAIKTGKIQITGAKVENVQQLAVIAQAFRDPRFETLRYVFVDGEGVIVHVESISSCIAGSCVINPYIKPFSEYSEEGDKWIIGINVRKDNEKWFKELAQIMKDKQATGYYLIHNHPSGFPEASKGDVTATDTVDKSLPGFISHIILDSNKYVELKKNPDKPNGYMGTEKEHKFHEEDLILKASKEHPLLSKKIESANDLSKIALELKGSDKYSTLVHVNAKLYVQGIEEVPNEMLKDTEYFKDFLKSRNIEFGSAMSFVVTNDKLSYEATKADMIKEAYIEDVLYVSSENQIKSYRQDNSKVNPKDGFWMGKRTSDYPTIRLEEIKERYNKRPFFSQLQRVIEEKLPSRIDKSALLGLISNPKNGIKQEEVKWSGLKDFIINKDKIDKKELLEFLRMNEIEIEETIFDNEEIVLEKKIKIATTKYIIEKYNLKELRSELNEYETQDVTYENKFFQVKFEMKDGYIKDLLSYDLIVPEDSEYLGTTTAIQYLEEEFLLEFREDYLEPIRTNIQKRTKHDKFQVVGGGQNYKELLFILKNKDLKQLPKGYQTKQTEDGRWTVVNNNGDSMGSYDSEAEAVDLVLKTSQELIKPKSYISPQSHWKELNVLAFTRFNDRYDSNGDNVLFLEEIQSDWHQEGRKKGYKKNLTEQDKESIADKLKKIHKLNEDIIKIKKNSPIGKELRLETRKSQGVFGIETEYLLIKGKNQVLIRAETEDYAWLNINSFNLFTKLYDSEKLLLDKIKLEINKIREEINEIEFQDSKIPDAPFKTTWHEFVLKRMIRYAAENGYDYLSWTTGNQQNERYNLKESVKEIAYWKENDDVFGLSIMGMNGNLIIVQKYLKADELEETFGNNIANKILNKEGKKRSNNFPPSDTKNVKYLTGDNLQIGGSGMKAFYDKMIPQFLNKYAKRWNTQVQTIEINGVTQQALPITLEMKDSVMIEGQSLFEEKDEYKPLTSENELELPPASGLNTSGKAKRASEIIGEFEKKFMNKVRVGKINRKNVLGYLQVRTHVIRLRKANDIPTFTHEAGHLIDKMYKLSDVQDRGIINELVRLGKMTTNSQKERVQ
ncbi:MAG: hypothetical protein RLY43_129, partial [Bacteroidota bacterium]